MIVRFLKLREDVLSKHHLVGLFSIREIRVVESRIRMVTYSLGGTLQLAYM